MRLLGAILAGGASRRFGTDKALALLDGKPLIAHVIDRLRPQVAAVVVVGRDQSDARSIPDLPQPGLGPLGGLNAALALAAAEGFDAVLTSGCDLPRLPLDLAARLGSGPAVALGQPLLGIWPVTLAATVDAFVRRESRRSVYRLVEHVGGREVDCGLIVNVNTAADLVLITR